MIQRLVDVLSQGGCELTDVQIMDSLWLSLQLPRVESSLGARNANAMVRPNDVEPPPKNLDEHSPLHSAKRETDHPNGASNPRPGELFVPNPGTPNSLKMRAMPVRVPAAESLPNKYGLNAALRPLKRRYPSSRTKVLDVTATID